jgi:hypothetical protein
MPAQIFLARTYNAAHSPNLNCHKRRVSQMGDPDGRIHPFVNKVYNAIDEQHICGDLWVALEKPVHDWS